MAKVAGILVAALGIAWLLVVDKVLIGVLLLFGAGALFLGSSKGPRTAMWRKPRVAGAMLFGIVAAMALALFVPEVRRHARDVHSLEAEAAEIKTKLESFRFVEGNVVPEQRYELESALRQAKSLPQNIATMRSTLNTEIAICVGAALVLLGCGVVAFRARA